VFVQNGRVSRARRNANVNRGDEGFWPVFDSARMHRASGRGPCDLLVLIAKCWHAGAVVVVGVFGVADALHLWGMAFDRTRANTRRRKVEVAGSRPHDSGTGGDGRFAREAMRARDRAAKITIGRNVKMETSATKPVRVAEGGRTSQRISDAAEGR